MLARFKTDEPTRSEGRPLQERARCIVPLQESKDGEMN